MPEFEILCLANSRKHQGRCVAGIRLDGEGWLRPAGWNAEGTLYSNDYFLADGTETGVLDVLRIGCVRPRPEVHHPENWLIKREPWTLLARPASEEIAPLLQHHLTPGQDLFGDTSDCILYRTLRETPISASLALVLPDEIRWGVHAKPYGSRQFRVLFSLGSASYDLPLTDQNWEPRLNLLPPGMHHRLRAGLQPEEVILLTISLSEPFQKNIQAEKVCHKLVAAVIVLPAAWRDQIQTERRQI